MRLLALAGIAAMLPSPGGPDPRAVGRPPPAAVVVLEGSSLPDLLAEDGLRALAAAGGVALVNGRTGILRAMQPVIDSRDVTPMPETARAMRADGPADAVAEASDWLSRTNDPSVLIVVVSTTPSAATAVHGDELGTVIAAWGDPDELLRSTGEPRALTSDSTRRVGVVADVDPAATVAEWLGRPYDAGAPIEATDEPAPLDLYERYLQQRRLAVPAAAAAWGFVAVVGAIAVAALALRRRLPDRVLGIVRVFPAAVPWLAIALLLVGHLPSLTVATVVPFVVGVVVAGTIFTRWVAARRGVFVGLAASGGAILVVLAIEAALGWPAAVTPLAGGGQLDGGRFFGMPNIEIGIVLGSALFVAHRVRIRTGVLLLLFAGLVAGAPWTGANVGAAIVLFAAAGLWWGIRRRRSWWVVAIAALAIAGAGTAAIVAMHRFLTDRPTHLSTFVDDGVSPADVVDRVAERLAIGADLLRESPAALIPVVGTLVLLVLVVRPPSVVARSFEGHDAWRDAVLVLLIASILAYVAEDTGAAALGFGFGFALAGIVDVSFATAREKMTR